MCHVRLSHRPTTVAQLCEGCFRAVVARYLTTQGAEGTSHRFFAPWSSSCIRVVLRFHEDDGVVVHEWARGQAEKGRSSNLIRLASCLFVPPLSPPTLCGLSRCLHGDSQCQSVSNAVPFCRPSKYGGLPRWRSMEQVRAWDIVLRAHGSSSPRDGLKGA